MHLGVATLAGARLEAAGPFIRILREVGEVGAPGGALSPLAEGVPQVWDGRFEIEAHTAGLAIAPLAGRSGKLTRVQRNALKAIPAAARPCLPAVIDEAGAVTCPTVAPGPRVTVRSLVFARLAAALGAVNREAAIGRMAKTLATT